jgi:hypothetical protein
VIALPVTVVTASNERLGKLMMKDMAWSFSTEKLEVSVTKMKGHDLTFAVSLTCLLGINKRKLNV